LILEEKIFNKPGCGRGKQTFIPIITILTIAERWSMSWTGISVLTELFC